MQKSKASKKNRTLKSNKFKPKEELKPSLWKENKKIIILALILCGISIAIILLQPLFTKIIENNPNLNAQYQYILSQLDQKSFFWLFIICFLGSLLVFPLAVDFIFAFYIITNTDPVMSIFACFSGVVLGRIADYFLGFLFSNFVIKKVIKNDIKEFEDKFSKWGISMIFFGHFIPFFPLEPLSTFLGTIKFDFWKFLIYTCLGKIIKLILIVLFFKYFFMYGITFMTFNFIDLVRGILTIMPKPF